VHAGQEAKYLSLQHENQEAVKAFEARTNAQREATAASSLLAQKTAALAELGTENRERGRASGKCVPRLSLGTRRLRSPRAA
jgi:hypothetical protein